MALSLCSIHLRSYLLLLLVFNALARVSESDGSGSKFNLDDDVIDWMALIPPNVTAKTAWKSDSLVTSLGKIVTIQPPLGVVYSDASKPNDTSEVEAASKPRTTSQKRVANFTYSPFEATATSYKMRKTNSSEGSFINLLFALVQKEFTDCDLVLAHGEEVRGADLEVVRMLSSLPNEKQMLRIASLNDFSSLLWHSTKCRGYFFLWVDAALLLNFTNHNQDSWDYGGRYIFSGITLEVLEQLVQSKKGRKTEHIVGLMKYRDDAHWGVYSNNLFSGTGLHHIGNWYQNKFSSAVDIFPDKTSDLRGIPLKAVIFLWEPSVMFREDMHPYGADVELIKALGYAMNFTVQYVQPPEGERWGEVLPDGSLTGLVGMVNRGEAEMAATNIFVSISRLSIIDFSKDYESQSSCLLVKTEPPLPKWQSLLLPFQLWAWFAFLIGLLIFGPLLTLLARCSIHCPKSDKAFTRLSYSWLQTYGMHVAAGSVRAPVQTSIQIYLAFLSIYCFIFTLAYSTNLTAFLTVERPPVGMEAIKELPQSGVFVIGVDKYYQEMLRSSPDTNLKIMADSYQVHQEFEDIFRLVQEGKGVFIDNHGYLEYTIITKFTKRGVASLRIMKECLSSHPVAMALQRHSPLKGKIDKIIGRLLSGGLIRRFFLDSIRLAASTQSSGGGTEESNSDGRKESTSVPLSLDHMQGIFFICAIGWLVSIGAFLVESMSSASLFEDNREEGAFVNG